MRKRGLLLVLTLAFVAAAFVINHAANSNSVGSPASSAPPTQADTHTAATVTTNAAGQTIYHYEMPASSVPTSCTVSLSGHDAQITFSSSSLDVTPACSTWIQSSAASGELWVNQPSSAQYPGRVCTLLDDTGRATATITDTGGATYGQEACTRLLAAGGWTEQSPTSGTGTPVPSASATPASGSPTLVAGAWSGTRPSRIDFSGDAGNVVTGIRWASWTHTQAEGTGTSIIQDCNPDCAQGTHTSVTTSVTLSAPQDGHFTEITEARNGQSTTAAYAGNGWPMSAS